MGRTVESLEKRKLKRKKRVAEKRKYLKDTLKKEIEENGRIKKELESIKKGIEKQRMSNIQLVTSVSKSRCGKRRDTLLSGGPAKLTKDVVLVLSENKISEGTFGIVHCGKMLNLNIKCAVKSGKTVNFFDEVHEANALQRLQGSMFFPHLFGILDKSIVMEYIGDDNGTKTVFSARNENFLSQDQWMSICHMLIQAVVFMHTKGMLHNDIKSNNIMLKKSYSGEFIPVVVDMGKVTLRKIPEVYRLSQRQRERYNRKYPHLAYELRNSYGSKTSTATDIYSLGYLYKFISDSDNTFLNYLQNRMLENSFSKRITSPDILRQFASWNKTKKQSTKEK